ncbi:uncharacterized protein IL334_007843 [Kwoniella shivajii]|uniref:Uncharacterized protein n=1 Tax=Kwoniella shivajii TaxID=564305 RepID=A0ABZ1DBN2_9TREE|nr:hypothetical protein IL334_007843 [Kwoniella shivajii]
MSTSESPLFGGAPTTAAAAGESASSTVNLFPTQSQSNQDVRNGSPNVYYLVFLGILVVLLGLAGCLALRAVRMRRRYRTATQIALARGDPLPNGGDGYWGLGGLAGWTSEGFDRLGNVEGDMRRREREIEKAKLRKKPRIFDEIVYKDVENELKSGQPWEDIEPISIQSLLPPIPPDASPETSPRPLFGFRNRSLPSENNVPTIKEINRPVTLGEPVRMGVIIQMPTQPSDHKQKSEWDEEDVGWENGMELGVWEGRIQDPLPPSTRNGWKRRSEESEEY